jgi:hypothetical protein
MFDFAEKGQGQNTLAYFPQVSEMKKQFCKGKVS